MKNQKRLGIIAIGLVIIVCMVGCATTVPIKSVKTPTIDTSNVKKLGVKGFENRSGQNYRESSQLAQYLSDMTLQKITATGKFELVAANDPNADGIFYGEIRNISSKDSSSTSTYKDKDGNPYAVTTYRRDVSVQFVYGILNTRTNMPIGIVIKEGSNSSSSSVSSSELTGTYDLARSIANSQMRRFEQDIVPTIVSTNETLAKETSKDKNCKLLMKEADALVKSGQYIEAIKKYDEVYSLYNSAAASINAGKVRRAIESDIAANAKMAELDAARGSLSEKAIKSAVDMLQTKLPANTVIMIMKQNNNERNAINDIIDQLTNNIVQGKKLTVVDRSNQAIINAEQKFQMSGDVDDNSAVSIGKQLGARYAVLCWVSGTMSSRKLNVKVLSIETSQIMDQSSFDI